MILAPKQEQTIRDAVGRVNLWQGAIRSGKTIGSLVRFALACATAVESGAQGEIVVVGRTRDSVWRNVLGPLQDPNLFGAFSGQVKGNFGAPTVTILGHRVHIMGASDAKAERVLRGLTVLLAYVDEATVIPEEFFVQLLGRMSPPGARMFATTNPDGPRHWLKANYLDRIDELPDWRSFHFILDDNPSLEEEYRDSIKREFTGLWFRRFVLGEWVAAEGAIYPMWDDDRHVVDPDAIPPMRFILGLGVDYGTTNHTRGELLGLGVDDCLYLLDEWAPPADTDAGYSVSLRTWLAHQPAPEWIYTDPAAASLKRQLWEDGLSNVVNASNTVAPGIRTVASLLGMDRLKVSSRCTDFLREVTGYTWDPKATERGEDAPVKLNDHALDAARYVIHSSRPTWSRFLPIATIDTEEDAA